MPADGPKRLNWEWEELVLACDLVMQNNGRGVDRRDPRAIKLSQVLREMKLHPQTERLPDFRNENGVAQKTRNLVQHLPGYTGRPSRGNKQDREIVERFLAEPEAMHALAESIRGAVAAGAPLPPRPSEQAKQPARQFSEAGPAMLLNRLDLSGPDATSPLELSFAARVAEYQRLFQRTDVLLLDRDSKRATRTSSGPIRSQDARAAVLLRSEDRCENPECTGDIKDRTDSGAPILEIDHIHDLGLGGDDDPVQMIALCPNCHATKTRGHGREQLRQRLFATALERHRHLIDQ